MKLQIIDYLILIPLAWGLIRGIMKGFIIEIASLLAFWLGIVAAWKFSDLLKDYLSENVEINQSVLPFICFVVLFALVAIGVMMLGKVFEKLSELILLGWLNKLLGGLFGLIKNALVVSVFLFALQFGKLINHEHYLKRENSLFYEPLFSGSQVIWPMLKGLLPKREILPTNEKLIFLP
jgi:membrane protein required for colicin V production